MVRRQSATTVGDDARPPDGEGLIHPSAVVEAGAVIGSGTRIWHHAHVRAGSCIGSACTVGFGVYIDVGVLVGDRCKIQNHCDLYQGVVLEDDVFVGPAVAFTNDIYPRAVSPGWKVVPTRVRRGASIGANATIVCGVELGAWSMVGAGAVVTADVPSRALVFGAPARVRGWVCDCGRQLTTARGGLPRACSSCGRLVADMVPR